MEFIVGISLALFVYCAAAWLGMDRDRVFYPAVLMATASYYVAFAISDGHRQVLVSEIAICAVFTALAVAGFKRSLWLVVAALAGHGVMDIFHHDLVHNSGVPNGWTGFCLTFDLTAAALVGYALVFRARPIPSGPARQSVQDTSGRAR
jgi:hypothetical protein